MPILLSFLCAERALEIRDFLRECISSSVSSLVRTVFRHPRMGVMWNAKDLSDETQWFSSAEHAENVSYNSLI